MINDCAEKVVPEVFGLLSNGKQELVEDDFVDPLVAVPELEHIWVLQHRTQTSRSAGGSQYSAAFNLRQIFRQMDRSTSKASEETGANGGAVQGFLLSKGVEPRNWSAIAGVTSSGSKHSVHVAAKSTSCGAGRNAAQLCGLSTLAADAEGDK